MEYSNYTFFEKYGLADLIYNYLEDNVISISDYNINNINGDDLIEYFNDVHRTKLENELLMVKDSNMFKYTSLKNLNKSPDAKNGEYVSQHVLLNDEKRRDNLFKIITDDFKIITEGTFVNNGTVCPFSTKVLSPFKRLYNNSHDKLSYVSNLVALLTRNKLSFYNGEYYSYIPEFVNLIDYVYFIQYVDELNRNIGNIGMECDIDKFTRPNRQYKGNYYSGEDIIWNVDNDYYNDKIRDFGMLANFYNTAEKFYLSNTMPKNWYLVKNGSVKIVNFNKNIIELTSSNNIKSLKESIYEFKVNGTNVKDADRIKMMNFLERSSASNLNKLLVEDLEFNKNNVLINNYINKTNMDKISRDIVINFSTSLSRKLYLKAKEYEAPNVKGELIDPLKERVQRRKFKLIKQVKGLIKRSSSLLNFLGNLSDFYEMHSLNKDEYNLEEFINLMDSVDFSDMKDLLSISLHIRSNNQEKEIEEEFDMPM